MKRFVRIATAWMLGNLLLVGLLSWAGHRPAQAQGVPSAEAKWADTGAPLSAWPVILARTIPTNCTPITQDIEVTTTWTAPCYRIEKSQATILETVTLYINPAIGGTWIVFTQNAQLDVKGHLQALGTADRPITFTSGASSPARGDWEGINFGTNSTKNRIQYAIIEYAGTAIAPSGSTQSGDGDQILSNTLRYNGSTAQMSGAIGGDIDYSEIRNNTIYSCSQGIVLNEAAHNSIVSNTIHDIDSNGLFLMGGGQGGGSYNTITNNTIFHCQRNGISLQEGAYNTLYSNTITSCRGNGVILSDQNNAHLRYNLIYSNAQGSGALAGVIITDTSANVIFSSNQMVNNGTDQGHYLASVYVYGMDSSFNQLVITGNVVYDEHGNGIYYAANNQNPASNLQNNALCSVPPSEVELDNRRGGQSLDARNSWWSTNSPSAGKNYSGSVQVSPWITLAVRGDAHGLVTVTLRDGYSHTVPPSERWHLPFAINARELKLASNWGHFSDPTVTVNDDGIGVTTLVPSDTVAPPVVIFTATDYCHYWVTGTASFPDLVITKTSGITLAREGDFITYTIHYANNGDATATQITITDQPSGGLRLVADTATPPWERRSVSPAIVWTLPSLAPGASGSFVVTMTMDGATCGAVLSNHAIITSTSLESNDDNNDDTTTATVLCPAIRLSKTGDALSKIGDEVHYTFYITNATVPAASPPLLLEHVDDSRLGDLLTAANSAGCGQLAVGASCRFTLPYTIPQNAPDPLVNVVTATYQLLGFSGNVTATAFHSLNLFQPAIQVRKTGPQEAHVGNTIAYTFQITNTGSADSPLLNLMLMRDTGAGWAGLGDLTAIARAHGCDSLSSGATCHFDVSYTIPLTAPSSLTNTVTITYQPQGFPNLLTATDRHALTVIQGVNLVVVKDDDVGPLTNTVHTTPEQIWVGHLLRNSTQATQHREFVYAGDLITYTIAACNTGAVTATNVVLTETLPTYTTYVERGFGWTYDAPRVYTMPIGTLEPGACVLRYMVVQVDESLPFAVNNLDNLVCGWGDQSDIDPADNCNHEDTPVRQYPLRVTKGAPACVSPGQWFRYVITYENTTGDTLYNVTLTDTLDISATYRGGANDYWTCNGSICTQTLISVPAGMSGTLSLPAQLAPDFPYQTRDEFINRIEIQGGHSFELHTPVCVCTDLSVAKHGIVWHTAPTYQRALQAAWAARGYGHPPEKADLRPQQPQWEAVRPGEWIVYRILYANLGIFPSSNVVLTETLPAHTTYQGQGWTQVGDVTYTLSPGDLPAGTPGEAQFIVKVDDTVPATVNWIYNHVSIGGTATECNLDNNEAEYFTPLYNSGSPLHLSKQGPATARTNDIITYTIVAENTGDPITGATLTDALPEGLEYVAGSCRYTINGGTPHACATSSTLLPASTLWQADLGTGDRIETTFAAIVRVDHTHTNWPLVNCATLTWGNNSEQACFTTDINPTGTDLLVMKNDHIGAGLPQEFASAGELVTYTIAVLNTGSYTITGIVLTETLPLHTQFVSSAATAWTQVTSRTFTHALPHPLAPGEGYTAYFLARIDSVPVGVTSVVNRVCGRGKEEDLNPANNCWEEDTPVLGAWQGIWLSGRGSDNIMRVGSQPPTATVYSNIPTGAGSTPFGITGDGQRLYVVNFGDARPDANGNERGTLSVIDPIHNTHIKVVVGTRPTFAEVFSPTGCVYVPNYAWPDDGAGGISVYCPQVNPTEVATTILPNVRGFFGIAGDPDSGHIFVTNRGFASETPSANCSSNYMNEWCPGIYIIDAHNQQVTGFVPTGESPMEAVYKPTLGMPGRGRLYVIIPGAIKDSVSSLNEVWAYEYHDGHLDPTPAYKLPLDCQMTDEDEWNGGEGIATQGNYVYISNYCGHSLSVIQDTSPAARAAFFIAPPPSHGPGTVILPHYLYLPLIARNYNPQDPKLIRIIYFDDPGTVIIPRRRAPEDLCTGRCPKGIGFYNGYMFVSLFRSNTIARVDSQYNLTFITVPGIKDINQVYGWK